MNLSLLSSVEMKNYTSQQFLSLENALSEKQYTIDEIGSLLPGSVMVQDLSSDNPSSVTYMNDWGCNKLNHSMEEIQKLGEKYYSKFFVPEQIAAFRNGIASYFEKKDCTTGYHFFQQVKTGKQQELEWYFTMCKYIKTEEELPSKLLVISNPVASCVAMSKTLDNVVKRDLYRFQNFSRFEALSKREKEIIVLLSEGKSSREIADHLYLSLLTVETHRKNIRKKLDINSLAELIKFALAFDLISF